MNIQERRIKVIELHNEGHTQREISKILDVGKGTVQRDLKSGPKKVVQSGPLKVDRSKESGPPKEVVQNGPVDKVVQNDTPQSGPLSDKEILKQEIEDLIKAIPPLLPECKKVGYNSELGFHNKD